MGYSEGLDLTLRLVYVLSYTADYIRLNLAAITLANFFFSFRVKATKFHLCMNEQNDTLTPEGGGYRCAP